ncbi:exodeoxyribonuclease VII small subunit [Pelistega sp. NLN82]|uniref:Exodeoxyribonuclease 7 small subunit n=1 Tax=Pelistega ratti TaxID=2652177 RepID=A0A6L9Y7I8_9BURK|nr:exodeoxyribonuclease VII small subunit [Pelistega ratti]
MKKTAKIPASFEEALSELEQIVQGMEDDMLSLEESLKAYERGVLLARVCQEKLDAANQQIQVLQNNLLQPLEGSVEEGTVQEDDEDGFSFSQELSSNQYTNRSQKEVFSAFDDDTVEDVPF